MTEDQLRIEYKLDLIITALQQLGFVLPVASIPQMQGLEEDPCPVCGFDVQITIDLKSETYKRRCGCKPPKQIVKGISALTEPPESEKKDASRRTYESEIPPDPEESTSSNSGGVDFSGAGNR